MAVFPTTRWSLIQARQRSPEEDKAAWRDLVRAYQPVILGFFRRSPLASEAEDLAQEFILRSISENWWSRADPAIAGFRTFLQVLLKRFLAQQQALGHRRFEGTDNAAESADPGLSPEQSFDLQFALCLARAALADLHREYQRDGRGALFAALQRWLLEPPDRGELIEWGARLQVAPNTLAVQLKRLRLRLQKTVRVGLRELSLDADHAAADLDALRLALASDGAGG